MICPHCRQDNPAHARFCLGCGARLAPVCTACGTELPAGARFCLQCGQAVAAAALSPSPETYTPGHLAERILTSRAALEGERKHALWQALDPPERREGARAPRPGAGDVPRDEDAVLAGAGGGGAGYPRAVTPRAASCTTTR